MQTLGRAEAVERRSPLIELLIALAVGFVATLAKRHLDFHLGIPGHAGVGWIGALTLGRLINGRVGMATVAGLSMGLWGVPIGLGHSLAYNALLYGLAGAVLDSALLVRLPLHRAWGAAMAGTTVHVAKYGFIFFNAWMSNVLRNVEVFGFVAALGNHIAFGALGGLGGWSLWKLGRRLPALFLRRGGR